MKRNRQRKLPVTIVRLARNLETRKQDGATEKKKNILAIYFAISGFR